MLYFMAMTAGCCIYAFMIQRMMDGRGRSLLKNEVPHPLALALPMVWLALFSGLRKNIGDTVFYRHSYNLYLEMGAPKPVFELKTNILFGWAQYYATQFRELEYKGVPQSGQLLLLTVSLVFLVPALVVLYRYSEGFSMALFLFFAVGTYYSSMNGIRQYAAAGIILMGAHFYFEPNLRKACAGFLPIALLASAMHSSALIMIPVFFLVRFRAFSRLTMLIPLGAAGMVLFSGLVMPQLMESLQGTDYEIYTEMYWLSSEGGSSLLRVMAAAAPLWFAYRYPSHFEEVGVGGDVLINTTIMLVAINILGLYNWIFVRLAIYLYVFQILFLCKVFSVIRKEFGSGNLIYLGGIVLFCVYAYFMNVGTDEYRSVWMPNFRNLPPIYK